MKNLNISCSYYNLNHMTGTDNHKINRICFNDNTTLIEKFWYTYVNNYDNYSGHCLIIKLPE